MTLSRKQFLQASLAAAAAGLVPACGDDETGTGSSSTTTDTTSTTTSTSTTSTTSSTTSTTTGTGGAGGSGQGGSGGSGTGGDATGGSGGGMAGGNCLANGTTSVIAANHGHSLTVPKADVAAAMDKTYDITGAALHSHMVTITAAQFAMLAANQSIMVTSTSNDPNMGHTHLVTVDCA